MNSSAQYAKIVEWSEQDHAYVGSCPGLFYGGCHGSNEQEVFAELCRIVAETIELYELQGKNLPEPTSGRDYANKMLAIA
jgi:predicted RNase H-like HicB family nuclease